MFKLAALIMKDTETTAYWSLAPMMLDASAYDSLAANGLEMVSLRINKRNEASKMYMLEESTLTEAYKLGKKISTYRNNTHIQTSCNPRGKCKYV